MTDFLTRDSNNRLEWLKTSSGQTQKIRLAAIIFLAFLVILIFSFPLIELYRGDIAFVNKFMDEYIKYILIAGLSLLAGTKLPDLFK